jgi:hypothetical protein
MEKTFVCFSKLNKWFDVCCIHTCGLFWFGWIQIDIWTNCWILFEKNKKTKPFSFFVFVVAQKIKSSRGLKLHCLFRSPPPASRPISGPAPHLHLVSLTNPDVIPFLLHRAGPKLRSVSCRFHLRALRAMGPHAEATSIPYKAAAALFSSLLPKS